MQTNTSERITTSSTVKTPQPNASESIPGSEVTTREVVKRGRKSKATEDRLDRICKAIGQGQTLTSASRMAGIDPSTLFDWINGNPDIAKRIQEAEGKAEEMLISLAIQGATKDGRIALMMLERRFNHWRKRETVAHTHTASDALKTLVDTRRERDKQLALDVETIPCIFPNP